ncbi:unnamed protein product [Enterobius vermicularis]|uniref:SH2 domain-containing protein n=1 Tax=Enterobius vermicularis TaxID=51028 RepID=A0A0N4VMY6_ENTVE|nr:unnamed protein product [Enterobius vermicularis]
MSSTIDADTKLSKTNNMPQFYSAEDLNNIIENLRQLRGSTRSKASTDSDLASRSHLSAIRNHHQRKQRGRQRCNSIDKAIPYNYIGLFSAGFHRYSTIVSSGSHCGSSEGNNIGRSTEVNKKNSVLCSTEKRKFLIGNSDSKALNQTEQRSRLLLPPPPPSLPPPSPPSSSPPSPRSLPPPRAPPPPPPLRHILEKRSLCVSSRKKVPIIFNKNSTFCNLKTTKPLESRKSHQSDNFTSNSLLSLPASPALHQSSGKFCAKFEAKFGPESSGVTNPEPEPDAVCDLSVDNDDCDSVAAEVSAPYTKSAKRHSLSLENCSVKSFSISGARKNQLKYLERCSSCPPEEISDSRKKLEKYFNINILEKTVKNRKTKRFWRSLNVLFKSDKSKSLHFREITLQPSQTSLNSVMTSSEFGSLSLQQIGHPPDRNHSFEQLPEFTDSANNVYAELPCQGRQRSKRSKHSKKDMLNFFTTETRNLKIDEGFLVKASSKGRLNKLTKCDKLQHLPPKCSSAKIHHKRSISRSYDQLAELAISTLASHSSSRKQQAFSQMLRSNTDAHLNHVPYNTPVFWTPRPIRSRGTGAVERRLRRGTTTLFNGSLCSTGPLSTPINEMDNGIFVFSINFLSFF